MESTLASLDDSNRKAFAKFANKAFDEKGNANFKMDLIDSLSSEWCVLADYQKDFMKIYYETFYNFSSGIIFNDKEKELEKNNAEEIMRQEYEKLIDQFKKQIENNKFQDSNFKSEKTPKMFIDKTFKTDNLEETIKFYNNYCLWYRFFYSCLGKHILYKESKEEFKTIYNEGYYYTEATINDFKKAGIKYVSNIEKIKNEEDFVEIDIMHNSPRDFVCKEGAIKINARIDEENSFLGHMTQSQIDNYINNNYTKLNNGFYRYIENDGTSYLLSREKLSEFLFKECFYLHIEIEFPFNINANECFIVEKVDKNTGE